MKYLIGLLIGFGGVAFAIYVGGALMFVGGVTDLINQIKAVDVSASIVAWALLKMLLALPVGTVIAVFGLGAASTILKED